MSSISPNLWGLQFNTDSFVPILPILLVMSQPVNIWALIITEQTIGPSSKIRKCSGINLDESPVSHFIHKSDNPLDINSHIIQK